MASKRAVSLLLNQVPEPTIEMPSQLTRNELEKAREYKILTEAEFRERAADLFGITMSNEALRDAKEFDELQKEAQKQSLLGAAESSSSSSSNGKHPRQKSNNTEESPVKKRRVDKDKDKKKEKKKEKKVAAATA